MAEVYISIGNSDDKLTQKQWSEFWGDVALILRPSDDIRIHGVWMSPPAGPFQNACWCIEHNLLKNELEALKDSLRKIAQTYNQDSIAWAEVRRTEFLD